MSFEVLTRPGSRLRHLTPLDLAQAVDGNDKRRFERQGAGRLMQIRACHGHSGDQVETANVATRLLRTQCPRLLAHGTLFSALRSISEEGLLPGGSRGPGFRQDVHLVYASSQDYSERQPGRIGGIRGNSEVIVFVDPHVLLDQNIDVCLSRADGADRVYLAARVPLRTIVYFMDLNGSGSAPGYAFPEAWRGRLRGPTEEFGPVPQRRWARRDAAPLGNAPDDTSGERLPLPRCVVRCVP